MLDFNKLTTKVEKAIKAFMDWKKADSSYSTVKNTRKGASFRDTCQLQDVEQTELGTLHEAGSFLKLQEEIEAAIQDSCLKDLHCQLILPQNLTSRVSEDIVRMSMSEPCGVHGCAIYIKIQDKGIVRLLSAVYGNTGIPPTFEIHLTLREDTGGIRKLQKAFLHVKECILNSAWKFPPKIIRSSYQLEKRKLYRTRNSESMSKAIKS